MVKKTVRILLLMLGVVTAWSAVGEAAERDDATSSPSRMNSVKKGDWTNQVLREFMNEYVPRDTRPTWNEIFNTLNQATYLPTRLVLNSAYEVVESDTSVGAEPLLNILNGFTPDWTPTKRDAAILLARNMSSKLLTEYKRLEQLRRSK